MSYPRLENAQLSGQRTLICFDCLAHTDASQNLLNTCALDNLLPSIKLILERKASILLLPNFNSSSNGNKEQSKAIAKYLSQTLKKSVETLSYDWDASVQEKIKAIEAEKIFLLPDLSSLENIYKGEKPLVQALLGFADIYVNEMRSGNSLKKGISLLLPKELASYTGSSLFHEIEELQKFIGRGSRNLHVLIGGVNLANKLNLLQTLLLRLQAVYIGGALSYTFLHSRAVPIGNSVIEKDLFTSAFQFLEKSNLERVKTQLPVDHLVNKNDEKVKYTKTSQIATGFSGVDLGQKSTKLYEKELKKAENILWYGPLGISENTSYQLASRQIAKTLEKSSAKVILIGKESTSLLKDKKFQIKDYDSDFVIDFLREKPMPGLNALAQ